MQPRDGHSTDHWLLHGVATLSKRGPDAPRLPPRPTTSGLLVPGAKPGQCHEDGTTCAGAWLDLIYRESWQDSQRGRERESERRQRDREGRGESILYSAFCASHCIVLIFPNIRCRFSNPIWCHNLLISSNFVNCPIQIEFPRFKHSHMDSKFLFCSYITFITH